MSAKPWDLLNPNEPRSLDEVKQERLLICKKCPEYVELTSMCKKCGCIMELKTRLENVVCPIGKW